MDAPAPVAVILAAGKSTRMKSAIPKVLHEVCGRPMIDHVLDAVRKAGAERTIVVVGHEAEQVKSSLSHHADVEFALQSEQNGTGHAVMMCADQLANHNGPVLILAGDTPLLQAESLIGLLDDQKTNQAACVIGTAKTQANKGLGRIVRDSAGEFVKIVEEKDANPEEQTIQEINTGCFAFDCQSMLAALKELKPDNSQAEYYLTDCPKILKGDGKPVIAACRFDIEEAIGVNTRVQLAEVIRVLQNKHLEYLMTEVGVTIISPEKTSIDPAATIGQDTVIYPFTSISGAAEIGENCKIGPHVAIHGPINIEDGTVIGPFETI